MLLTAMQDIIERVKPKLSECTLAKLPENGMLSKPINEYDKPLEVPGELYKNCPIEGNGGHWESERGDSRWIPDPDFTPISKSETSFNNPDHKNWEQILDKYHIDGIDFREGEPNFKDVSKGTVEVGEFSDQRRVNFGNADIELARQKGCSPEEVRKWREANGYTWHECKDMKTMQKVPNEVHANVTHSGGISKMKEGTSQS